MSILMAVEGINDALWQPQRDELRRAPQNGHFILAIFQKSLVMPIKITFCSAFYSVLMRQILAFCPLHAHLALFQSDLDAFLLIRSTRAIEILINLDPLAVQHAVDCDQLP